jgi:hypothetical protein
VRRSLAIAIVAVSLAAGACSKDKQAEPNQKDPLNAIAEVADPHADFGWDRTETDPAILATLMAVAQQVAAGPTNCVDPSETPMEQVRSNFEPTHLPLPAATVQCDTSDEEDLTFEGFVDEQHKLTFLEAKADLICERGMRSGFDPGGTVSTWPGMPYVDGGTWIIEPNDNGTRDTIATALGLPAMNMCPDISFDPAGVPQF